MGKIKFKRIEKSPLAEHFWKESHDFYGPVLLKEVNSTNQFEVLIWKNICIDKKCGNLLNWDISNFTPLLRFVETSPEDEHMKTNSLSQLTMATTSSRKRSCMLMQKVFLVKSEKLLFFMLICFHVFFSLFSM